MFRLPTRVHCGRRKTGLFGSFHASHLRTLLAFFGPWAPILIYVPTAHAERAEALIAGVFDPTLPSPTVAETFA